MESTCVRTNYAGEFIFYTATCNVFILYITLYMFLSWSCNSYGRHSSNVIMYTSEFIGFNTREHRKTYMHSVSLFREYIHWSRADFHLWNEHFPDYRKILWRHRSEAYQPHALTWASLENVLDTHDLINKNESIFSVSDVLSVAFTIEKQWRFESLWPFSWTGWYI